MTRKEKHAQRVEKVKELVSQNKLFLLIAVVLCLYLLGTVVPKERATNSTEAEQTATEQTATEETVPEDDTHWRFYPIDLWVLGIGGGFCTVMILKEKRKARETLK